MKKMLLILIIITNGFVLSSCRSSSKKWTAQSFEKKATMVATGAGIGAALGHQGKDKYDHAQEIGIAGGALLGYAANRLYYSDFDKGYAQGYAEAANKTKVDLLEKLQDLEMEGKEYLKINSEDSFRYYEKTEKTLY